MKAIVSAAKINGQIEAIASKSFVHRELICAALSKEKTKILCKTVSEDITATALCLDALTANVIREDDKFIVTPHSKHKNEKDIILNCGESGSTYRFLLPVAAALGLDAAFLLNGRLKDRPINDLFNALESHGIKISGKNEEKVTVSGCLTAGTFTLPGDISSQYITGLLFALPLLKEDSEIQITSPLQSKGYVDITLTTLKRFGITVEMSESIIKVKGNQRYISPKTIISEGDWSNAAFWLCAAAAAGEVTVTGLNNSSVQADRKVTDILKRFGAFVTENENFVTVKKSDLSGIEIDASEIPDLVPALATAAAGAVGKTVFYNADRLRFKESDRLNSISRTLTLLGADTAVTEDKLIISGNGRLSGGTVHSFFDHRIVMMSASAALISQEDIVIENAESVSKSYPLFFEDFRKLGANISEVL